MLGVELMRKASSRQFRNRSGEMGWRHLDAALELAATVRASIHGVVDRAELVLTEHVRMLVSGASSHVWFELLGRVRETQLGRTEDH